MAQCVGTRECLDHVMYTVHESNPTSTFEKRRSFLSKEEMRNFCFFFLLFFYYEIIFWFMQC